MVVSGAASALTGGVSAEAGETVVTGDSSASVQVTNVINSNDEGGSAHTIVEKTINGVKTITEEIKEFKPGEPVIVETEVKAESRGGVVSSEAEIETDITLASTTSDETGSSTEEESEAAWSLGSYIVEAFSNLFSSVWGIFVK